MTAYEDGRRVEWAVIRAGRMGPVVARLRGGLMEACRRDDVDPDWFHPLESDTYTTELAKKICRGCVLRVTCLEHALTTPETQGVWGGMSAKEREAFKKKVRRDALKTVARQRDSVEMGYAGGTTKAAPAGNRGLTAKTVEES